jgi:antitoxin (DNA-binding transcriptional repressor) of toxin-antitoxin stability system
MSVRTVGILEAKTHLSSLLEEVQRGAVLRISRHGKIIAELRPFKVTRARRAGFAKGTFGKVARDFEATPSDFADYVQ